MPQKKSQKSKNLFKKIKVKSVLLGEETRFIKPKSKISSKTTQKKRTTRYIPGSKIYGKK